MKGTEKQIKWAEDIKAQTIKNIKSHIAANEAIGMFAEETRLYKIMERAVENLFETIDDAAIIINKRELLDIQSINTNIQRALRLIRNGRLTVEQFAAANHVAE